MHREEASEECAVGGRRGRKERGSVSIFDVPLSLPLLLSSPREDGWLEEGVETYTCTSLPCDSFYSRRHTPQMQACFK